MKFMSKAIDVALKTAEQTQSREMTSQFSQRLQASVKDIGAPDTFRHTILSYVTKESYERAAEELAKYVESKTEYPQFKERVERYASYCIDLVNAIRAKRSFPGFQHLPISKQQDLFDRAMEHFEDLKNTLKKIEQIDREVKLEDVRSTVLVVKAVVYCMFALLAIAFLREVSRGVLPTAWNVIDNAFGDLTNYIFNKLGIF